MHKSELVKKVAAHTGLNKATTRIVINTVLSAIVNSLKEGQSVTLTGFGTFVIREKKQRMMQNVHTHEPIEVPAHKVVGFRVGNPLRTMVR